jgi:fucose permease
MVKYDLLVYLGLVPVVAVIMFAGFVIWSTPSNVDIETRKIRMADAILLGLLALLVFVAILYFVTRAAQVRRFLIKLQR